MSSLSLNTEVVHVYKWYKKLTGRFLNIAFSQTATIVMLTLLSQILLLLATMSPFKIIMLLGSPNIPGFFPDSWQSLDRDFLVVYLAIASILFYILHLGCEKYISQTSSQGSKKILQNNKKVVLFENQDQFAQKAYGKQAKSLSNIIFFLLSLIALMIIYFPLSIAIVVYVLGIYTIFYTLYRNNLINFLNENFNDILNIINSMGFFTAFIFILGSYLSHFYPPKTLVLLVSIILVRQMFSKLTSAVKGIKALYGDRHKINSLFFFKDTVMNVEHDKQDPFWSILREENRKRWIQELLDNIFDRKKIYINSQWYKVNIKNVAFFTVIVKDTDNKKEQIYLVKLFNKNISSQAIHEATLLQESMHGMYALPFIGSSVVKKFHCNLFDYSQVEAVQNFNIDHIKFRIKMISMVPPRELLKKYSRSHPYLYSRLNKRVFEKLYLVAKEDEIEIVEKFENSFENIIQKIAAVPLQITNPIITKFSLVKLEDQLVSLHWGGWKIDSLGVDFPVTVQTIDMLKESFGRDDISIDDLLLVALMSQFEKLFNGENFTGAIEVIAKILKNMK